MKSKDFIFNLKGEMNMAKNNGNYFTSSIGKYNTEDFVTLMTPEEIQRDAKRIFREMIKGKIDFAKYGKYFQDPKFTDNLIAICDSEYRYNSQNNEALRFYDLQFPGNQQVAYNIYTTNILAYCYGIIFSRLQQVKSSMYENVGVLTEIPILLRDYRNIELK